MSNPLASAILMPFLLSIALSTGCPSFCICKWRNGKQTVECTDQDLLIIPKGIDIETQVLDVSGNNFQYIQRENFLRMGLINLQKLFLSKCEIKTIHDDAFKGLTNLVELDLAENMLAKVPTEALLNCPSLMRLNLSKNPISSLDRLAFNHLSFLTTLDVSGCEISEVHEAAFSSLYGLEWIDLSHNKIQWFPEMRFFPTRLKGVQLQDNPWVCDCHIRSFNFWLKRDVVPILIPPLCQEPKKLRSLPIKGLEENELACAPEVTPASFYFELEEGRNITLLCQRALRHNNGPHNKEKNYEKNFTNIMNKRKRLARVVSPLKKNLLQAANTLPEFADKKPEYLKSKHQHEFRYRLSQIEQQEKKVVTEESHETTDLDESEIKFSGELSTSEEAEKGEKCYGRNDAIGCYMYY